MQTLAQLRSGALEGSVSLKLSEQLTHFPEEIFELADTLEVLDLSQNQLTELPADFGRLKKLRIFFCSDNLFTILPEVLGDCPALDTVGFKANRIVTIPPRALNPNLRWLILTNNRITALPGAIGNCPRMQKLALAGNELSELPEELCNCLNLGLLRISANRLRSLPEWLLSMPQLAWLAFSGNQFNLHPYIEPLPAISWQQLKLGKVLGEGASGVVFKAVLQNGDDSREIAVKIFKGAVTSDGVPEDEMHAFIAAGAHPGLVHLTGQLIGHPDGKTGLVMELIPDRFYNLGMPPSMASCTRDVFRPDMCITVEQAVKIAATIASVATQLHDRGILHGDLYAHNTLIDDNGNTLFGDFGAASFYNKADMKVAYALERLEVKSFGYMLDDLIGLCREATEHPAIIKLQQLRDIACVADVSARPGFQWLSEELMKVL